MSNNEKLPDFASQEAGEYWAQMKADFGNELNIQDVKGTGKDGAITKANVVKYVEELTGGKSDSKPDEATGNDANDGNTQQGDMASKDDAGEPQNQDGDTESSDGVIVDDKAATDSVGAHNQDLPPQIPTAKDFKEVKPLKGKILVNLTGNTFDIEGVIIEPNGEVELTPVLKESARVAHAVDNGVLGIK